jgi:hypothetical protein
MKASPKSLSMLGFMLSLLVAFPCSASPKELRLRWSELAPFVLRQDVALVLPSGAFIEGNAVVVRTDALVIHVRHTTDAKAYPKGPNEIPRSSVSFLRVTEMRGRVGRTLGGWGGALLGWDLAFTAVSRRELGPRAAVALLIGVTTLSSAAGHYLGSKIDKRTTSIRIDAD